MKEIKLDKIINQYNGCGLGILIVDARNDEPKQLLYLNNDLTNAKVNQLIRNKSQNIKVDNHIYIGEIASFTFLVSYQLITVSS